MARHVYAFTISPRISGGMDNNCLTAAAYNTYSQGTLLPPSTNFTAKALLGDLSVFLEQLKCNGVVDDLLNRSCCVQFIC